MNAHFRSTAVLSAHNPLYASEETAYHSFAFFLTSRSAIWSEQPVIHPRTATMPTSRWSQSDRLAGESTPSHVHQWRRWSSWERWAGCTTWHCAGCVGRGRVVLPLRVGHYATNFISAPGRQRVSAQSDSSPWAERNRFQDASAGIILVHAVLSHCRLVMLHNNVTWTVEKWSSDRTVFWN